jgi:hypothetical protein
MLLFDHHENIPTLAALRASPGLLSVRNLAPASANGYGVMELYPKLPCETSADSPLMSRLSMLELVCCMYIVFRTLTKPTDTGKSNVPGLCS